MTSKTKLIQLQRQYDRITYANAHPQLVRFITQDGRLLDKEGYLLSESETRVIEKENEEVSKKGGMIILLTNFSAPRTRQTKAQ